MLTSILFLSQIFNTKKLVYLAFLLFISIVLASKIFTKFYEKGIIKKQQSLLFLSREKMFTIVENKLEKEFEFKNFNEALEFVNVVGELAEQQNHHPDILLHSYKKVKIILFTHSDKSITQKDYDLAEEIEKLYN